MQHMVASEVDLERASDRDGGDLELQMRIRTLFTKYSEAMSRNSVKEMFK
jgi:hypothetical protein